MADSPLHHSLASLHSFGASSFGPSFGSRPSSRAQSDASFVTARPGSSASTRSISHEIDHIKSLIARSADVPKKSPTGSITAQVFRQRSTSSPNVAQAHIYHELDQLKRRIRQEQQQQHVHQLTRRISQIDPGQESESDPEEVPDEREVELERAREDVIVVRQRLDGLLERAELRIDRLTVDKEKLEAACEHNRERLAAATAEGKNLTQALAVAQTSIEHLQAELQESQRTSSQQQSQLSDLQVRTLGSEAAYEEAQQQVDLLKSRNTELETSLVISRNESKKALGQLELIVEHQATHDKASKDTIAKLQEQFALEVAKGERFGAEVEGLRAALAAAEASSSQANSEHEEQCGQLSAQLEEVKALLQHAMQDAATNHVQHQLVAQSRDELAFEVKQYQTKLQAALEQQQRTEKQLSDAQSENEKESRELCEDHGKLVAELQQSDLASQSRLEERAQSHAWALQELTARHGQTLENLKTLHQSETERARQEAANHAGVSEEAHARTVSKLHHERQEAAEQTSLERERQLARVRREKDELVESLQQGHQEALEKGEERVRGLESELVETKRENERQLAQVRAQKEELIGSLQQDHQKELRIAEERMRDLESKHAEEVARRVSAHDALLSKMRDEAVKLRREALSQADEDAESRMQELRDAHALELQRARQDHDVAVDKAGREESSRHEAEMQDARKEASDQHLKLSAAHLEQVTILEARFVELQSKHQGDLETARQKHEATILEISDRRALESQTVQREAQTRIDDLRATHEASLAVMQDNHMQALEGLSKQHSESMQAAHERYSSLHASNNAAIEACNSQHKQSQTTMQEQHKQAMDSLSKEYSDHVEAAEERYNSLQASHNARLTSADTQHEHSIAMMQGQHQQAVEGLKQERSESLQAAEVRYSALQASHKVELDARDKQHEQFVMQLRDDHSSELEALRDEHERQIRKEKSSSEAALQAADSRQRSLEMGLAAALSESNEGILQLQQLHHAEISNEHDRAQKTLAEAAVTHQSALESLTAENQSTVSKLQSDLSSARKELAWFKTHSAEESARTEADHERRVSKLEAGWSQMAEDALNAHKADLQKAADEAVRNLDAATQRFQAELSERDTSEAARVAEMQDAHAQEAERIRENAKTEMESVQAGLQATKERLLTDHGGEVALLQSQHEKQLEKTQSQHKAEIDALCEKLEATELQMRTAIDDHGRLTAELHTTHAAELQRMIAKHDQESNELQTKSHAEMELLRKDSMEVLSKVNAIEAGCDARIEDLKLNHDMELTILKNEIAAYAEAIRAKTDEASRTKREIETLQTQLEDVRFEAEESAFESDRKHRAALESAVERARQSGQAELRNLKKRHQDAVSQIRATAERQAAAQLTDLEKSHQRDLSSALESERSASENSLAALVASHQEELIQFRRSISESHQADLMRLETEHQSNLAELESRLQDERVTELSSREAAYLSEVTTLQARLDASLTGQAEAERAVAKLRQQVVKTDRRSLESKASAEDQVAIMQRENDDLSKQLTLVQSMLRDLQRKSGSASSTPTREAHGELASLRLQLDNYEEERLATRRTLEKRSIEKLELARQNEFLVKELEVLLSQRSRAKKSTVRMVDALVQTESFVSELKVDLASVQLLKVQARTSMRPTTPLSPGQRQAKDEIELAWTTRSFEDYLDNARTELSQLGSVISANESLFARKISEHVGELQKAKDQLAADYDARITSLAADKEMMEAMVLKKQQAAFAKDREELVASYSAGSTDPYVGTGTTGRHSVALRNAEERLVADYNKRIFRRKSQIALKHAEEFQNLTRDYDRKVANLIDNRSRLEGDLSIDPVKFENDLGELEARSARLAQGQRDVRPSPSPMPSEDGLVPRPLRRRSPTSPAEEERSSRSTRTSTPRTSLSIPRSASIPRAPSSGDKTGAPTRPQTRKYSEKHPPVPQLSLMRVKTPSDTYPSRGGPSPLTSPVVQPPPMSPKLKRISQQISPQPPPRMSSRGKGDTAQDLSIEPSQFERQQFQRQSSYVKGVVKPTMAEPAKPGFLRRVVGRISSDTSRPGSSSSKHMPASSASTTASSSFKLGHRARSKSTKLSSGMIYYQAPKQSPSS